MSFPLEVFVFSSLITCFIETAVFTFAHERNWLSKSGPASGANVAKEAVSKCEVSLEKALGLV